MKITTAACLGIALCAVPAGASVVPIAPFVGDAFETFEEIGPVASYPGGIPIFGGAANFNDMLTNSPWIVTSLSGGGETVLPYDGFFMGLAPTGWISITFDTPITRFGGYLAATAVNPAGNVTFLNEQGDVIDSLPMALPTSEWSWYGWESSVPVSTILLRAGANPGTTVVADNLQVTFIPAPGAAALLLAGAWLPRRRRR